jgi:hypothetical protein
VSTEAEKATWQETIVPLALAIREMSALVLDRSRWVAATEVLWAVLVKDDNTRFVRLGPWYCKIQLYYTFKSQMDSEWYKLTTQASHQIHYKFG